MSDQGTITPYSSVAPLFDEIPSWVPETEQERLAAYDTYERIYWSDPRTFRLTMRGTNDQPIYVPNARTVVNETAHYLLKGLRITPEDGDMNSPFGMVLDAFLKRERFYSKFSTAKWSGVVRGDWVLHLTADPNKPEGMRISVNSVDPAAYFPIPNPDDLDDIIGVDLVETFIDPTDDKVRVRKLRYTYQYFGSETSLTRKVLREEAILELEGWWKGEAAQVKQVILKPELLPDPITTIPVYHFKNIDWQGDPYGRSELKGFEFLQSSINQTVSDEELALALAGLGFYATDAPTPTDAEGNEEDWEVAPASIAEVPTGSKLWRVEGVQSVKPFLEHTKFLVDSLFEGSGTFRTGQIDVSVAESGVALAIKFLPTLAKLEQRDLEGVARLENFWFDWKFFWAAYEGGGVSDTDLFAITLGDKLPTNRIQVLNELNNMLDRMVIDREYYRAEITKKLGYEFPADLAQRIIKEQEELTKARMFESPVNGEGPRQNGGANNATRPNESAGTEA